MVAFPALSSNSILNPVASPVATTKFYLTATLGICSGTDSVTVLVNPAPIPDAGSDITICFGKSVQLHGNGGSQYQWSPDTYLDNSEIQDPTVTQPTSTIIYDLAVTDINGCKSLQSSQVTVTVSPPARVFAGDDTAILVNQTL